MLTYIFHCDDYEVERNFKVGTTDSYVDAAFDDWVNNSGLGYDEIDEMIDNGEAGYYEI